MRSRVTGRGLGKGKAHWKRNWPDAPVLDSDQMNDCGELAVMLWSYLSAASSGLR